MKVLRMNPPTEFDLSDLSRIDLFRNLQRADLRRLSELLHRKTFPAGKSLMTVDQTGEVVDFILSGAVKPGDAIADFFDHTDRFVSYDQAWLYWIFPPHDMKIGAADSRESNSDYGLSSLCVRLFDLFDTKFVCASEDVRFHLFHFLTSALTQITTIDLSFCAQSQQSVGSWNSELSSVERITSTEQ